MAQSFDRMREAICEDLSRAGLRSCQNAEYRQQEHAKPDKQSVNSGPAFMEIRHLNQIPPHQI